MCDPGTLLILGSVAQGGGKAFGAIAQKKAADEEARAQSRQAGLAIQESEAEAKRLEGEGEKLGTEQKLAFLKNGVSLEGSPLLVLEDTKVETEKQVQAQRDRGQAIGGLGRKRASILKRQGRAGLIAGLLDAAGSTATGIAKAG